METANKWDYFFRVCHTTLGNKATGEPDFAELSVFPLQQDMTLIYYLNSSTGDFSRYILISANVCFSSVCIVITGGSLWSKFPLHLHNFSSSHFSSVFLISFWHSLFCWIYRFGYVAEIKAERDGFNGTEKVYVCGWVILSGGFYQALWVGHGVMTITSEMEWDVEWMD